MENKIEENTPRTHPKHECDDIRTKTFFNSEKYTGTKCGICDTILEFNWKVTPSSLPTDEEIEKGVKELIEGFGPKYHEAIDLLSKGAIWMRDEWLRTNFSSEEEGSEDLALKFAEWTMDSCVRYSTGLWQHGKDFGNRYTTSELYQIFKQEQQTTK